MNWSNRVTHGKLITRQRQIHKKKDLLFTSLQETVNLTQPYKQKTNVIIVLHTAIKLP